MKNLDEIIKFINLPLKEIIKEIEENKKINGSCSMLFIHLYNFNKLRKWLMFYVFSGIFMVVCGLIGRNIPNGILNFSQNDIYILLILISILLLIEELTQICKIYNFRKLIKKIIKDVEKFNKELVQNIMFNTNYDLTKYDNILNINSLQLTENLKLRYTLTPSEYVNKFKNEYLEENPNYILNTENEKYMCVYHSFSTFYFYLNQKILSNESDIKFVSILDEIDKLKSKSKKQFFKNYYASLYNMENIVRLYENKEYNKVYDILKQDSNIQFLDNGNIEYGESTLSVIFKQYLVLLYISSKKINKDLDFLPQILKDRLAEALQEEDYIKFIERELA